MYCLLPRAKAVCSAAYHLAWYQNPAFLLFQHEQSLPLQQQLARQPVAPHDIAQACCIAQPLTHPRPATRLHLNRAAHVRKLTQEVAGSLNRQLRQTALCPDGCKDGYCAQDSTYGGLRCQKCDGNLIVSKVDGTCGEC